LSNYKQVSPSVVISTKNRFSDLIRSIESCLTQTIIPEVIVIDDGSSDETAREIPQRYPGVKYLRRESSRGCIVRRNEGAVIASGEIIFSIDDDAEFKHADTVEQTLGDFSSPSIAAVAIPLIEPKLGGALLQSHPDNSTTWITDTFKGTAYAIRKTAFLDAGGFRAELVHQGEETDLCIRLLDAGMLVRLGSAKPIYHYESPKRDMTRMHFYGRRNDILFALNNVPTVYLAAHALGTTLNGVRASLGTPNSGAMLRGIASGYSYGFASRRVRKPVKHRTYRLFRRLRKAGPLPLPAVLAALGNGSQAKKSGD
jgi:glycosyltransferase involved in cell wall biosynthesis